MHSVPRTLASNVTLDEYPNEVMDDEGARERASLAAPCNLNFEIWEYEAREGRPHHFTVQCYSLEDDDYVGEEKCFDSYEEAVSYLTKAH